MPKAFKDAEQKARTLSGVTGVSVTDYAVFAHGADWWICAEYGCLALNPPGPPLGRHTCGCGSVLAP